MNNRQTIGIVVAVSGLLLTCCLCPLVVNSLYLISSQQSLYGQLFSIRIGQFTAATYVIAAQYVCASVLALVVLIFGIVMLVQARNTSSASSQ